MMPNRRVGRSGDFAAAMLLCISAACNLDAPPVDLPVPTDNVVSYAGQIQPIFEARCNQCHVAGAFAGFLDLTADSSYGMLVEQPSTQRPELTLVRPGDSSGSLLFQKVSMSVQPVGGRMPLFGAPLTAVEIARIRDWIDQGAMDN